MTATQPKQLRKEEKTTDTCVPEGWAKTALSRICIVNPPKPSADTMSSESVVTFVPMSAVEADQGTIASPETRLFGEVRKGYTAFRENDVILAKITPCMENGKSAIARSLLNGLGFGSTEFHVLRPTEGVLPEYVFHYVRQESYRKLAEGEMTGSVGQKRVPRSFLERTEIPLPPLPEQKRIVAKVEELLEEVNKVRDRLDRVPKILKRFRQSVLAAACSGRLSTEWRRVRGALELHEDLDSPTLWERQVLGNLCSGFQYGSSKKSDESGDVPVLRMGNLQDGEIDWKGLKYSSDSAEISRYSLVFCPRNSYLL